MLIDLHKTLDRIKESLPTDRRITFEMLEKSYEQTLWLRSHILGVMYDMIDFGSATKRVIGEVSVSQTDSDNMVCLVIPEPLPGLKELTGAVEEHLECLQYTGHLSEYCRRFLVSDTLLGGKISFLCFIWC